MNVSTEFTTIEPHGGELVDRLAPEEERDELLRQAEGLTKIVLGPRALSDLEMISTGVFSPLTGFMVSEDYESVVETMRLKNGLVWSLPITLPVSEEEADGIRVGEEVSLTDATGRILATMLVEDRYSYDKEQEAREVFGTTNEEHPGVAAVYRQKDVLIGGEVTLLVDDPDPKPRAPLARVHPEERPGDNRRPAPEPPRGRDPLGGHPGRREDEVLRDHPGSLLPQGPHDARGLPRGHALRGTARGHLPRHLPQELRLYPLYRRTRPRGSGEGLERQALLRRLRRPAHLRRVRG